MISRDFFPFFFTVTTTSGRDGSITPAQRNRTARKPLRPWMKWTRPRWREVELAYFIHKWLWIWRFFTSWWTGNVAVPSPLNCRPVNHCSSCWTFMAAQRRWKSCRFMKVINHIKATKSINQAINKALYLSIHQSINQLTEQSIRQPTDQSINHSFSQSSTEFLFTLLVFFYMLSSSVVPSLTSLCRDVILTVAQDTTVLPLPPKVLRYLAYQSPPTHWIWPRKTTRPEESESFRRNEKSNS